MIDSRRESNFRVERQIGEDRNRSGLPGRELWQPGTKAPNASGEIRFPIYSYDYVSALSGCSSEATGSEIALRYRARAASSSLIAHETPFVIYLSFCVAPAQLVGCYYSIVYRGILPRYTLFPLRAPFTILPLLLPFSLLLSRY